jgi:hypothetical protein
VVSSRSKVPVVRSRNIAMLVTRNMITNGKMPSMTRAIRSKVPPAWSYMKESSTSRTAGTTTSRATVRRSWRSCRRIRAAVEKVIRRLMPLPPARCRG